MYKLFIGNKNYSSWSLRPWILMQALEIPFEEELIPFEVGTSFEKFRSFSRSGLVPCLHDGDTVVWDSLAITEYLAERHPAVWPADTSTRAWARCVSAEMHSGFSALRNQCSMNCGLRVALHGIDTALRKDIDRIDEIWAEGLSRFGGPFLAGGSFTAADAFYAPVACRVQTFDLPLSPAARQYADALLAMPAMQEWYEAALQEPWREIHHEEEILDAGRVLHDFRNT